ncbi:MAG TPA: hypothetical protein VK448_09020 [Dissulfurispiraceae bacterium]|nr:hypothetical protein [Dissulfurispiraceae bacterium]
MTSLKILKWLSIAIITPWLVFMVLSAIKGGEIFTRMGDSVIEDVRDISAKLSRKADMVKIQADEWKEKLGFKSGEKAEEAKPAEEKVPAKKTKKAAKTSSGGNPQASGDKK